VEIDSDAETDPLFVISSQSLQAIPWECVLAPNISVIRAWTLGDVVNKSVKVHTSRRSIVENSINSHRIKSDKRTDKQRLLSSFWIGYHSQGGKSSNDVAVMSKQLILKKHVFYQLQVGKSRSRKSWAFSTVISSNEE